MYANIFMKKARSYRVDLLNGVATLLLDGEDTGKFMLLQEAFYSTFLNPNF